uniref:Uncharacterized protein MANES_16G129900 n=1 Tax=Rhizophora mucronata TaxID=61149 RepID=A0A2P2MDE0_RHIMU
MIMDEISFLLVPAVLAFEPNMIAKLINSRRFLIQPWYGNNKRKVIKDHVNPVLIINLLLEFLHSFGIKCNMACNIAHLWLTHFKHVGGIFNTVTAKNFSKILCIIHNFGWPTIRKRIIRVRKLSPYGG